MRFIAIALLAGLSTAQHNNPVHRRRHHSKIQAASSAASSKSVDAAAPTASSTSSTAVPTASVVNVEAVALGNCKDGDWACTGQLLQQCSNSKWVDVQTCSGGTVCSGSGSVIGCVWPYQVQAAAPAATKTILKSEALPTSAPATTLSTIPVVYTSVTDAPAHPTTAASITFSPSAVGSSTSTSSAAGTATPSSAPVPSNGMKWVVYSDYPYMDTPPPASSLGNVNVLILAFWLADLGAVDNAGAWTLLNDAQRQAVKADYKANGKTLMVSAFGSTDTPTSSGYDAKTLAQRLAVFVTKYEFDGVDIDYEDFNAFNGGTGTAWLITFQTQLRQLLPEPYIITHAPVAPWFTTASLYADGGYLGFHKAVGSGVSWYNFQFYNQGSNEYTTCEGLIEQSSDAWPNTAVNQLIASGISPSQIVIGKPSSADQASNGYMSSTLLGQCMSQAPSIAGGMFWQLSLGDSDSSSTNFISSALSVIKR